MNAEIKAGIHNRFDIEVIDAMTGEVRQRAKALNVVCDALFTRLFASEHSPYFAYMLYGSGSGTPSASDTALFTYSGYKIFGGVSYEYDSANRAMAVTRSAVLGVSDAVGVTLTEVGIGYDQTHIVTHAMLEDMNGNPISIEKTDTDIINIYATVFVHAAADYDGIIADISYCQSGGYYSGLAAWLAGLELQEYDPVRVRYTIPCNAVTATRDYPIQRGESIGIEFHECTVSLDASNRALVSTVRFAVDHFNVDGGIKYLCFNSYTAIGSQSRAYLKPSVIIPVGTADSFPGYSITADSIGTGDGSKTAFQTHFDVARDFVLKVNGAEATNFTRDGRNITFAAAPEIGAVVTADYFTDTIPKDADHVYDLTVTITVGEYAPE